MKPLFPSLTALTITFVCLASAVTLAAWPALAQEPPGLAPADALFAEAENSFARGDLAEALRFFVAAKAAGAAGPAVDYNIGVCQYQLGQYGQAEATFRDLASRFPGMRDLAEYNIGLALNAQGRAESAMPYFERVERSADTTLSGLAAAMLGRIAPADRPGASAWSKYVDLGFGRDGNVALLEDSVLPIGQSSSSPFVEILGFTSGRPGASGRWRIDLSGYGVAYPDASDFNQLAVSATAVREFEVGAWSVGAGPRLVGGTLDGDGFEQRIGVQLLFARSVSAGGSVRFRFEQDDVDAIDERFDYIAGDRQFTEVAYVHAAAERRFTLSLGLETNDRTSASVSPDRRRIAVAYRFAPLQSWTIETGLLYRRSEFDALAAARSETLWELSLGARRDLRSGWQLSAGARVADNASNDPLFDYSRARFSLGLSKAF